MLNYIWIGIVLVAVVVGALSGKMQAVSDEVLASSITAVMKVALPLGGMFTLMLGMMRLVEKSGLITALARFFRPLLRRLFPDVPADHPAMGAMMMNIAANLVGAGNAATPFGLRAMTELEKLNPHPGTATNAMCTFLVVNTSALMLVSTTALLLLKQYGSTNPSSIIGPSILASAAGLTVGLVLVKLCQRLPLFALRASFTPAEGTVPTNEPPPVPTEVVEPRRFAAWQYALLGLYAALLVIAFIIIFRQNAATAAGTVQNLLSALSPIVLPGMIGFFVLYAALAKLDVFDTFIEGAKDGMQTVLRIIPYLVAMIVAIGLLRASGTIELLTEALRAPLAAIRFPADLLPMALMRPLSGSGSQAVLENIIKSFGADNILSRMAATMYGSTETTFYVLAVYFGAVGIRRTRHALVACLTAEVVAMGTAIFLCQIMFGRS
ncbi:MAG: nucleoside recognition domain-containing protein [Verrucomicrobiales bacterium]